MNEQPSVEVIESPNRIRTASARLVAGKIIVRIPEGMPAHEQQKMVETLVRRVLNAERRKSLHHLPNLKRRVADLNGLYFSGKLTVKEIKWVTNQQKRYGSCTPSTATIRISDRIGKMPLWVLDYVLVHELAHLLEANHSPAFWKLVARYPLAERARGYLIAVGLEGEEGPAEDE